MAGESWTICAKCNHHMRYDYNSGFAICPDCGHHSHEAVPLQDKDNSKGEEMTWTIEERIKFAEADGWTHIESIKGIPPNPIVGEGRELPLYNTLDEIARVEEKFITNNIKPDVIPPRSKGGRWIVRWFKDDIIYLAGCRDKSELIARGSPLLKLQEKK